MFKELPQSVGLVSNNRTSDSHWGKPEVIDCLIKIGQIWSAQSATPISIGQISRKNGEVFPPHKTHRTGDDVDIRPMRKDNRNAAVTWQEESYSRSLTRDMIKTIRANAPIISILFNDPELIKESLCQSYPNHSNHLHVNFGAFPKIIQRSTVRFGDTGSAVLELQKALGITADGAFGNGTLEAVKKFQRDNGLVPDGVAGKNTWDKLRALGRIR